MCNYWQDQIGIYTVFCNRRVITMLVLYIFVILVVSGTVSGCSSEWDRKRVLWWAWPVCRL